jgi:hypothetical protein
MWTYSARQRRSLSNFTTRRDSAIRRPARSRCRNAGSRAGRRYLYLSSGIVSETVFRERVGGSPAAGCRAGGRARPSPRPPHAPARCRRVGSRVIWLRGIPSSLNRIPIESAHYRWTRFRGRSRRQCVTQTIVDLGVPHSVAQRLVSDPEVLGDVAQGAVAAANEANRLGFARRRIGRLGAGHKNTSS